MYKAVQEWKNDGQTVLEMKQNQDHEKKWIPSSIGILATSRSQFIPSSIENQNPHLSVALLHTHMSSSSSHSHVGERRTQKNEIAEQHRKNGFLKKLIL